MTPGIMLDIQALIRKALSEAHIQGMKDGKETASQAIQNCQGFTDDEKRIAIEVISGEKK
jgi:hypothetical protein